LGLPNSRYEVIESSLEKLPFDDSTFDVIWFNGVLQHVARPSKCLTEVVRVLRVGGKGWLYAYGAGGFYWRVIGEFRKIFSDWTAESLIASLVSEGISQDRIAEAIDD
jgi:ubiquinone/menaquinone biosynthesis C-methylase UbiE